MMNQKAVGILLVGLVTCMSAYPMANDRAYEETIDQSIKRQHWTPLREKTVAACAVAGFAAAVSVEAFFNTEEDGFPFPPIAILSQIPALIVASYGLPECSFNKLYSKAHRQYDPRFEFEALDATYADILSFKADLERDLYILTDSQWQQLRDLENHVEARMYSH
jgi:hypothetical protein